MDHSIVPASIPGSTPFYLIILVSFIAMYLNTALGMGYGVTMVPVSMVFFGYAAEIIVPVLLIVQVMAEFASGYSHQTAGNIDLTKSSQHLKVLLILAGCAIVVGPIAVLLFIEINHMANMMNLFIGVLILLVGISIFLTMGRRFRFSWRKVIALGLLASFIKGTTGSGYGPIVTGGQVLTGVGGKQSIGIKTIAEGITCLVIVMAFFAHGSVTDFSLGYPMIIGAICSVPISAWTVRKTGHKKLTTMIASFTIFMGILLIGKTLHSMGIF